MVSFHIETCRHGIEINQVCDKCVALSDAPMPPARCSMCGMGITTPLGVCDNPKCSLSPECTRYIAPDSINHPPHYTQHPSGVECIAITEHYNFNVGNAIKYLWRAGLKDGADAADDLRKAAWYVQREIDRPIQPTEATVYCGLCLVSLTSPFCPNQQCPQSPLYDGQSNAL